MGRNPGKRIKSIYVSDGVADYLERLPNQSAFIEDLVCQDIKKQGKGDDMIRCEKCGNYYTSEMGACVSCVARDQAKKEADALLRPELNTRQMALVQKFLDAEHESELTGFNKGFREQYPKNNTVKSVEDLAFYVEELQKFHDKIFVKIEVGDKDGRDVTDSGQG